MDDLEMACQLWEEFGDVPVDENDCITCEWRSFPKGTCRFDIWKWFEVFFDVSVAKDLMYPDSENDSEENRAKGLLFSSSAKCPRCGSRMKVSALPEYAYQCLECDEDFYAIECKETYAEARDGQNYFPLWVITLHNHGKEWYEQNQKELDEICKRYATNCVFFDQTKSGKDSCMNFGWKQRPSVATIQGLTDEVMALLEE